MEPKYEPRQHNLVFELTIIVNTVSQAISEKNKLKKKIILSGLDLYPELPGASRNSYLPLDH